MPFWKWKRSGSEDEPEAKVLVASQWQLMWWKFRKHKLAKGADAQQRKAPGGLFVQG